MQNLEINVTKVEEYQMVENTAELERLFEKAKSTIVNGACVLLVRKSGREPAVKFDEIDTLEALEAYRAQVLKYL